MLQSHRDPGRGGSTVVCRALPGVDAGMCRGLPWSTGIDRDVPGRDSEILNMFKITGVCRGPPRWSSVPGYAVQAPCWRQDLPCLRRGVVPYWHRDVPYLLSLPLYHISAGVYRVGCGLGHGLGRDNHLLARHFLFFSSFSLAFRRCWRFSDQVDNDLNKFE